MKGTIDETMAKARDVLATTALLSLFGAGLAHADPAKPSVQASATTLNPDAFTVRGDFNPQDQRFGPQGVRKTFQWDAEHGRWTLKFDMEQPAGGGDRDVQAGAYFRVTPQLRVGGAVGLGSDPDNPINKSRTQQQAAPRVRLETAFKF